MKALTKLRGYKFLALLFLISLSIAKASAKEVIVGASPLKSTYYQGETIIIRAVVWNNGSSKINVLYFNVSIWRVEKRYNRLRNVENVYSGKFDANISLEPNQQFSKEIHIKSNLQPAQYNLSLSVVVQYTTGPATGSKDTFYIIPTHLFTIKPSFEIPVLIWAIVIEAILIGFALYIYKGLRR